MSAQTETLKKVYAQAIVENTIGSAGVFGKLANLCPECVEGHKSEQKAAAHGLYSVFGTLWRDDDQRPVTEKEATALREKLQHVLQWAVDFVDSPGDVTEAVKIIAEIADFGVSR